MFITATIGGLKKEMRTSTCVDESTVPASANAAGYAVCEKFNSLFYWTVPSLGLNACQCSSFRCSNIFKYLLIFFHSRSYHRIYCYSGSLPCPRRAADQQLQWRRYVNNVSHGTTSKNIASIFITLTQFPTVFLHRLSNST